MALNANKDNSWNKSGIDWGKNIHEFVKAIKLGELNNGQLNCTTEYVIWIFNWILRVLEIESNIYRDTVSKEIKYDL